MVLMTVWAVSPIALLIDPTLLGLFQAAETWTDFARNVGYSWLFVGLSGLLFRTVQLFIIKDWMTGLVWATKIITDPFHDIKLYHRAPLQLMRGTLIAPPLALDAEDERAESHR